MGGVGFGAGEELRAALDRSGLFLKDKHGFGVMRL